MAVVPMSFLQSGQQETQNGCSTQSLRMKRSAVLIGLIEDLRDVVVP